MKAVDLARLPEDMRIRVLGLSVMPKSADDPPQTNCFIVESNERADRYERKLKDRFPGLRIIERGPAPAPADRFVMVKFGSPVH